MSEQDLRRRMQLSVDTYLDDAVIDAAADLARGRRRLVRRRATAGLVATAAAVAAAIGVGALAIPAVVNAPSSGPTPLPLVARPPDSERDRVATQLLDTLLKHVDAKQSFTTGEPQGIGWGGFDKKKRSLLDGLDVQDLWAENGVGRGVAWASVSQPGAGPTQEERCGPKRLEGSMPYRCSAGRTPTGRPVVTGVATMTLSNTTDGVEYPGVRGYFVRYTRSDGQIVEVGVDGADLNTNVEGKLYPPVTSPKVTIEQLIAAATDPAMTLKK
ncbi:hypothetical protein [Kribbella sp. NPDC051620]|uniref:hypothetical protein n=1 Tax=Kribbella sp. NPDC051620 TaxID=3364120 RepID=UPI0037A8C407